MPNSDLLNAPICSNCNVRMGLVRVSLPISGPEHYWFECARCQLQADRVLEIEDQALASPCDLIGFFLQQPH